MGESCPMPKYARLMGKRGNMPVEAIRFDDLSRRASNSTEAAIKSFLGVET